MIGSYALAAFVDFDRGLFLGVFFADDVLRPAVFDAGLPPFLANLAAFLASRSACISAHSASVITNPGSGFFQLAHLHSG